MPVLVCRCFDESDLFSVMDDIDDIDGLRIVSVSGYTLTIEYPEGDRLPEQLRADNRISGRVRVYHSGIDLPLR